MALFSWQGAGERDYVVMTEAWVGKGSPLDGYEKIHRQGYVFDPKRAQPAGTRARAVLVVERGPHRWLGDGAGR